MTKITKLLFILLLSVGSLGANAQTLYDVVLGTDNVSITEVQIEFNGNTITQTSGGLDPAPVAKQTSLPVLMNYVKINDGGTIKTLNFLNAKGALLASNNFTNSTTGVGVYDEGVETLISDGVAGWEDAMQDMVTNRNALSYMFYDGSSNTPAGDDFDIYWSKALTNNDYLVVSERDGNTFFRIVPLDINGNPIASARELRFGKVNGVASPNGNKKYDWNIGYGSAGRFADQPQHFSVVDVDLFNTSQPIYGFRIDNNGDADVKFYGISDDTFENNPTNPLVPGIEGNVFNDTDELTDSTVDGTGISTPSATQLYVSLLDDNGVIVDTMPVNADGSYSFLDDIEPNSDYTVVLHTNPSGSTTPNLPATWVNTGENQGTAAGNDGNVDGILAVSVGTVTETEVNFGIVNKPGSIGDTVWYDADGNGAQNGVEVGLEGATVTLDPGTPGDSSDDVSVLTDSDGEYLFSNLPAGDYTVSVDVSTVTGGLPVGVTVGELSQTYDNDGTGSANTSDVTLGAGENNLDQDFGYEGLGSIGDTVWYDADGNGAQNGVEGGLEGATVTLDPGTPGDSSDDVSVLTDSDGEYLFSNLPAGDYTVSVDVSTVTGGLPVGVTVGELSQTYDNDGTGSANTSDVTLAIGEDNLDQDFGYQGLGSIGDTVWYDADGNGAQNGVEGGLEGATVTLDPGTPGDSSDDVSVLTDSDGEYLFSNLPAGDYTVSVDVSTVTGGLPVGVTVGELSQTYDNDGTGSANTSDVTLGAGEDNLDQDFGYQGLGSIGDTVWYDADGNGAQNGVEVGLEGATVTLDPGTPGDSSDDVSVLTDSDGEYLFSNLPAGDYIVSVDVSTVTGGLPVGVTVGELSQTYDNDGTGSANTSDVTLGAGENNLDQDFGYEGLGSIGDTVWYDADGNGAQNGVEVGLEGATVTLDPGTPGDSSDDVSVLTDSDGEYLFSNLPAGDYTVSVDVSTVTGGLPLGVTVGELSQTYDNDGTGSANTSDVTLAIGEDNLDQDFGYQGLGSIGDTVWYDADGNGAQNGVEVGLEGATVTLDPGTPGDSSDDVSVLTDSDGEYLFSNLPAGDYTVSVDVSTVTGGLPVGVTVGELSQTYDNDGTGSANTSDVTLGAGENNLDQDFGYEGLGSIGDTVWYDADGNGAQNGVEGGLEGATVTLDPGTPGDSSDDVSVLTDSDGEYLFSNLPAGDYTVSVDVSTVTGGLPVGVTVGELSQTYDNDGTGSANTSDVTLAIGEDNLDQDFGYEGVGSIGDTVWYDADGNGAQNGVEVGLEGATVTLDPGTPGDSSDDVSVLTDSDGEYLFSNLPAGDYTVSVDVSTVTGGLPVGVTVGELSQTYDNDGTGSANTSDVTLEAGEENDAQDFGYEGLGSIGDTVWYDFDGNGVQSGGAEVGLEGATVTLDPGTPGDSSDDVSVLTDSDGEYLFSNLPAGDYTVSVDVSTVTGGLPTGITTDELSLTFDSDGIDTPNTSDVTLAIGEDNTAQDFGYVSPECLTDDCKVTTFEAYLVNKGWDLDGVINGVIDPAPEVATIKHLDIKGKNLRDLNGIEYFTALETLIADDNELTVIDLKQNVNLKHLSLKYNDLIGINVRDNILLEELHLEGNKLTEIDVSNALILKHLGLRYNEIEHLDVRPLTLLESLETSYNKLEELLLGNNCNLAYLNAGYNDIDVVDLDGIKCVVTLLLNDNNLSGILDLTDHTQIETVNLCNNNLDNYPPGSCDTVQPAPVCFATLEEYMVDQGLDLDGVADGNITPAANVATMTYLNITGLCIQDMSGIELFTSLEELHMAGNLVTTVDLSSNTLLRVLDVSGNQLTGLDVSNQVILEELYAGGNLITTIDLSSNTLLKTLSLKGNKLTSLDLTPNEALVYVEVQGNELEDLILGYKMSLTHLYAGTNKLTSLDIRSALNLSVLSLEYNDLEGTLDLDNNKCIVKLNLSVNPSLEQVLFKNGFNNRVANDNFNIVNTPSLTCVKVDAVTYSTLNWTNYVEDASVFTSADDCSSPVAPVVIEELDVVGGSIVVPADVIAIKIFKQSGRVVANANLQGVYFVMTTDVDGVVRVQKIFVE
ncbi:SdrD B-like domain-containing protein [Wenyingzhuangia sp. IMCC45574]